MVDLYNGLLSTIIGWQQQINFILTDYFDELESGDTTVYLIILAISFLYGLIHALGPGHGKMVIASYFLAKDSNKLDALKAGFLTSLIHTISALLITGVLYISFQNMLSHYFKYINQNMYKVSAVFIIIIALFLLYEMIKDKNIKEDLQPINNKRLLSISLSIGIVPCPGVMTIVLYSMILGYIYLGILSAITMSIGMGLTISLAAIASSSIKNSDRFNEYKSLMNTISYVGVFILFTLGTLLLL